MQRETPLAEAREIPVSRLKRGLLLCQGWCGMKVELDGGVLGVHYVKAGKVVFGRQAVELFKVQSGVRIPLKSRNATVRLRPDSVEFRSQDPIQVTQVLTLFDGKTQGFSRSIHIVNRGDSGVHLRLVTIHDPTSLFFRRDGDPPGEIGVNAFNRGSQVVMDDVGDTTGVRVLSFSPMPSAIYMTRDKQRAGELLASGELPDSTAGMSGAILILSQQDVELQPGASADLRMQGVYHESSLEEALAPVPVGRALPVGTLRTSNPAVNFAFSWAAATVHSLEAETDLLERLSAGYAERLLRPSLFEEGFESAKTLQMKDGLLPRAGSTEEGPMETSLFILHSCAYLQSRSDKKLSKKWYPTLRKAGTGLKSRSSKGPMVTGPLSHGWRRRLGSGFPTGQLAEVNLVASRALSELSAVAYSIGKGTESATFKEASLKLGAETLALLKDSESGTLALNVDLKGRLHKEVSADQAVALSYNHSDHELASSVVHRLLEKDFETGYGPRTIPSSNLLYYNPTYGEGQLGGYWTRAALAHALLAYGTGYPVIAGQELEKVARLVYSDCEAMGGIPGEFPYWFDPEKRSIVSWGSDPVAAAHFIEGVITGELGCSVGPAGLEVDPPEDSKLRWVSAHEMSFAGKGSLFMGKASVGRFIASTVQKVKAEGSRVYMGCERVETSPSVECLLFWDQTSLLLCVGNLGGGDFSGRVSVPVRGKPVSRSLYADLDQFDPSVSAWNRLERKKLLDKMDVDLDVRSGAWTAVRFSQITS